MYLGRRKAQLLAAGILGGFFLIGFLLTETRSQLGSLPKIEIQKNADGSLNAGVVIGEFNKSETKDGKKVWEVTATTAKYFPEKNVAELENGLVYLYRNDDTIRISSRAATVYLSGATLDKVVATGSVVFRSDSRDVTLKTEKAVFSQQDEQLECEGRVEIVSPEADITGITLRGDTGARHFTLARDVKTLLKPREAKSKNTQGKG